MHQNFSISKNKIPHFSGEGAQPCTPSPDPISGRGTLRPHAPPWTTTAGKSRTNISSMDVEIPRFNRLSFLFCLCWPTDENADHNCLCCSGNLANFYRFKFRSKSRKMHQNVAFTGLKFLNFLGTLSPDLTSAGYSLINHSKRSRRYGFCFVVIFLFLSFSLLILGICQCFLLLWYLTIVLIRLCNL